MGDPYWRYGASADRGSIPRPSFPGYLSSEAPILTTQHLRSSNDLRATSSDYLQKDIFASRPGVYGNNDLMAIGIHPDPGLGGLTSGASIKGYPSYLEDPTILNQRRDIPPSISPGIPDMINGRPDSVGKAEGLLVAARDSNILFVDGLPNDCSRRESGDKAMVLCFVEFTDAKCALTAMEALQGYKFDDKKPDPPILRIHFAHFPFRLPSDREKQQFGGPQ